MKYTGMPGGMWLLFAGSFKKHLISVLGYDAKTAGIITAEAKPKYKEIIGTLPEFEKADRFCQTEFITDRTMGTRFD